MKKLSSRAIFFYKRVFPAIWFGFIGLFLFALLYADRSHSNGSADVMLFVVPVFMSVIGYFIMKNLVFDLIDEVYDEGSSLLFKNNGKTVRINLTDINIKN